MRTIVTLLGCALLSATALAAPNGWVKLSTARGVIKELKATVRLAKASNTGVLYAGALGKAATTKQLNKAERSALFTAWAGTVIANADGGPVPWSPPYKAQVLSFLTKTSKDLGRFDGNHDGWLTPKDVKKANRKSRTTAAVLNAAMN